MALMPRRDDPGADDDSPVTLTGISVSSAGREQVLVALRLNCKMLHEPQPDAEVDEAAVRRTIDRLLNQLADRS